MPDSSLGPEIGPQRRMALSPAHLAVPRQALSLRALFCQHSTKGRRPSTVWKGTGSLSFIWEFHFQELEALSLLARTWLLIFSLANPSMASGWPWSGAVLTSLWKGPQRLWPGAEDSAAEDIWRGAGVRVGARVLLPIPTDSGTQGSWSWCSKLPGGPGSGVFHSSFATPGWPPVLSG